MRLRLGLLVICVSVTLLSSARADSLSVGFNNGTVQTTPSIVTFQTKGSDMNGMGFSFDFVGNPSAAGLWLGGSVSAGGATVSLAGDSFFSQWSLTNNSATGITKMVIDAGLGNAVFDQSFKGANGTVNSASGKTFKANDTKTGLQMTATYTDIVKVGASATVGDLYRVLTIEFTNSGGLAAGQSLNFWADTDTVQGLNPQTVRTPAPPALLLALFGAVPFFYRRRATPAPAAE